MRFKSIWMIIVLSFISFSYAYSAGITYTYDDLHRLSSVTNETCTQTTYTYDEAGNRTVKEVTKLDTTPPETSCNMDGTAGSNGWYTSNVSVTLNATDTECGIESTLYSTDNGNKWLPIQNPFTVMFTEEGEKELLFKSSDYGSNNEEQKSEVVKIDKTDPVISVSSPLADGQYSGEEQIALNVVITDTVSGIGSKTITLDGKTDVTGKTSIGPLLVGNHKVVVTATDKASRSSSKTISFAVGSSSTKAPDLIGKIVSLKQTCKKKKKGIKCAISGKLKVTNQGTKVSGPSAAKLYLSDDSAFDEGDTFLRRIKFSKIKKGKSLKKSFSHFFPLNTNASGKYVIGVIDVSNKVTESDEMNNEVTKGPVE